MTVRPLPALATRDDSLAASFADAPRWTARRRGFYEVYWIKWNDRAARSVGWLRFVLVSPSRGEPRLDVWACRLVDDDATAPRMARASFAMRDVSITRAPFAIEAPGARLTRDHTRGAIAVGEGAIAWDVALRGPDLAVQHLPSAMYRLPLPRGKLVASRCFTRVDGSMTIDGATHDSRGCVGQLAHFWGARNQPYFWVSCGDFDGDPGAFVEVIGGESSLGPVPLPPVAFVHLAWRGERYRLNDPIRAAANRYHAEIGRAEVEARSGPLRFRIEALAPTARIVAHPFVNPDSDAIVVHTSYFADVRLEVATRAGAGFRVIDELTARACGAFDVAQVGRDPRVASVVTR